jgi:CheY-like chemotaxis protein
VSETQKRRILVVDDDASVRASLELILNSAGYEVIMAEHGLEALLQLRVPPIPDVIITDLNMPQMSGFEFLSVVRRRFPEIPVIAASGAYEMSDQVPAGVIADAFFAKGQHSPKDILRPVAELLEPSEERAVRRGQRLAPVWIPRSGKDSKGVPFVVLTCTECLRSFPVSVLRQNEQEIQETPCLFCSNPVRYIIDFSLPVCSPIHVTCR